MDLNSTLETLRRALVQAPGNGFLWLQVAEILDQLGRGSEAEEAAREALVHLDDEDGRKRARQKIRKLHSKQRLLGSSFRSTP